MNNTTDTKTARQSEQFQVDCCRLRAAKEKLARAENDLISVNDLVRRQRYSDACRNCQHVQSAFDTIYSPADVERLIFDITS